MSLGTHGSGGAYMEIRSIEFSSHARQRIKEREIPAGIIIEALKSPDAVFWDVEEKHYVVVKYTEPGKGYMIVFDVEGSKLIVVTVLYSSKLGRIVESRRGKRWLEAKVQLRFKV